MSKGWALTAGLAWGLALWVSLFEPLILFLAVLGLWGVGKPRALLAVERRSGWAALGGILILALLLEGWRVGGLPGASGSAWLATIGEMRGGGALLRWVGWGALASPFLLLWKPARDRRLCAFLLLALLAGLSLAWIRWGYFFALAYAMTLPRQLARLRPRGAVWIAWLLLLWPVWRELDAILPGGADEPRRREAVADQVRLREVAGQLRKEPPGAVLAPWWQSPALAYWSGHPMVAGSSHESLPGIRDSARFFMSKNPADALAILRRREVRYVVAYDTGRVIQASAPLVSWDGSAEGTMADILYRTPRSAPPFLREIQANNAFKVFALAPGGR